MLLHFVPRIEATCVVVVLKANRTGPYLALAVELWLRTAANAKWCLDPGTAHSSNGRSNSMQSDHRTKSGCMRV